MSSRSGAASSNPSSKGKAVSESGPDAEQLSRGVSNVSLGAGQGDGWEVYGKKSRSKAGNSGAKQWAPQNAATKVWGHPDVVQKLGMKSNGGQGRGSSNSWPTLPADSRKNPGRGGTRPHPSNRTGSSDNYYAAPVAPMAAVPPPLQHGWSWGTRNTSVQISGNSQGKGEIIQSPQGIDIDGNKDNETDEEVSDLDDDTDDELMSDDFDSDASQKSHDTRKKNRWFKELFECLDKLTVEQIDDPERQWHCPACKGGPGAIDWYKGLQPLVTHAKTKGSKRVKLHRELASLLDEELRRRGTSVIPAGEVYGMWKGLDTKVVDKEIVWPPMVVIMNTRHEKDENEKWIGMGNQELLDCFSSYAAVRARHSYGPQGHRGMSVLIFEATAVGFVEAERLGKHFEDNGRNREAWERNPVRFYPGGKRQLYGYMAEKRDLDFFNQHSQGKSKLKFEMRSYEEMVVNQMKQMSEDNQLLIWFKNKVAKEQRHSKALEESYGVVSEKLRKTLEENRIVRLRTKMHHEQNKEEMEFQEQFFKDQIRVIHEERTAKEEKFEKIQQEEREKVRQTNADPTSVEINRRRSEDVEKFIQLQEKDMEEFVAERDKLFKAREEKMAAMKLRHWEEEVALEREFDSEFNHLMEKYTPHHLEQSGSDM